MAQRKVVKAILREAKQRRKQGTPRKAVRKRTRAALATGIVESGLRNLPGGDADSQGWRQERASLYPNPRDIKASVDRFFDEAAQFDRPGLRAGELAALVQRPAAQYRGRYGEVIRQGGVRPYMKGLKGAGPVVERGRRGSSTRTRTRTRTTPGLDNSQARKQLLAQYLLSDQQYKPGGLLELRAGLDAAADVPGETVRTRSKVRRKQGQPARRVKTKSGGRFSANDVTEMFHDPGISVDNGKRTGAIGGHSGHVHFASRNPKAVRWAARLAKQLGLHVGENDRYDPGGSADTGHTSGSFHYQNFPGKKLEMAIDVSGGDAATLRKFNRRIARKFGV